MTSEQFAIFAIVIAAVALAIAMWAQARCTLMKLELIELQEKPPEKPKMPRSSSLIEIRTQHGVSVMRATAVRYPNDGRLYIDMNNDLSAVYERGEWLSAEVVPAEIEPKEEPAKLGNYIHDYSGKY